MAWSEQQEAIFEAAEAGKNVIVNADAGSGKSTLELELAQRIRKPSLMLSFNRDIKIENEAKARELGVLRKAKKVRNKDEFIVTGHLEVSTFHSWGWTFFPGKKPKINKDKVFEYCYKRFKDNKAVAAKVAFVLMHIRGRGFLSTDPKELIAELRNPTVLSLGEKVTDTWIRNADQLAEMLRDLDNQRRVVDFDDMCRQPVLRGWIKKSKTIPAVLYLDEIQDLNPDQRRMVEHAMIANPKVQVIAAGDDKQSIYGFRGAHGSMDHMREIIGGVEMPLNTTYRTHSEIVSFVNGQISGSSMIAYSEGGEVHKLKVDDEDPDIYGVQEMVDQRIDMIISSRNSTLISVWIELFVLGIDANLKGSGVVEGLYATIRTIQTFNWKEFQNVLREMVRAGKKSKFVDSHADTAKGLLVIINRLNIRNKHELINVIKEMNLAKHGTQLETVHSAKGREADRVGVICDWWADKEGQKDNLRYVSFTRAKRFLMVIKPAGSSR